MSFHGVLQGCNAVCYLKDNKLYGMTCAWVSMVDYDVISLLLGGQSDTGNNIKVGDVIGVSALAKSQKDIAIKLGSEHSKLVNKFTDIDYKAEGSAVIINHARTQMVCVVKKILHLNNNEDNFLVCQILSHKENKKLEFLSLEDVY